MSSVCNNAIYVANNKGAEQPAHMRRLICAFDVRISYMYINHFSHDSAEINVFSSRRMGRFDHSATTISPETHHVLVRREYYSNQTTWYVLNSIPTCDQFCRLPMTFTNSLDPDQDRQNVGWDGTDNMVRIKLYIYLWPLLSSVDAIYKQFGPRSGPTECRLRRDRQQGILALSVLAATFVVCW